MNENYVVKLEDETLMAFADGELDTEQSKQIERALQVDYLLRQRVNQIRQQSARVATAFTAVLDEPIPDRLTKLLQTPASAAAGPVTPTPAIVRLDDVRAKRQSIRFVPTWAQLGGMAASVLLGVVLGARFSSLGLDPTIGLSQGQLVASGAIDQALWTQLASEPDTGASVAVQLSFINQSGNYCRTFSTQAAAGLACQELGQWVVQQVTATQAQPLGAVRQAATTLPPSLLDAVDKTMVNGTLDTAAERQARAQGWRQ